MAVEIMVPVARRLTVNANSIPLAMRGKLTGVLRNKKDISEMTHMVGGRGAKPLKPLMIVAPDERTVLLVVGAGVADAAELEDLAYHQLEKAEAQTKKTGRSIDIASRREKQGLPQAGEFDEQFRDALRRRVAQHKANPRTDPPRAPERPPSPAQYAT